MEAWHTVTVKDIVTGGFIQEAMEHSDSVVTGREDVGRSRKVYKSRDLDG